MNDDLIAEFIRYHGSYNSIGADRLHRQEKLLREFEDYVGLPLTEATGKDFSDFLARESERTSPANVAWQRGVLRPFFKWAWRNGHIDAERLMRLEDVPAPRGANTPAPRPYSRDEVKLLWRDLAVQYPYAKGIDDPVKQQEKAGYYLGRWQRGASRWTRVRPLASRLQMESVIALALYGGLRRSEIFSLQERDCHPDNEYVAVLGARKNRSGQHVTRAVPWTTAHMHRLVARWLRLRTVIAPTHEGLILSLWGDHYREPMPFKRFELLLTNLGRGWEFHRLRHTAATEMLRAGYEIERVQKIMGHSSIAMTLRYAKIVPDDILKTASRQESELSAALAPPELLIELHGLPS